jgi:transcriptional regulator of NAD metabolism
MMKAQNRRNEMAVVLAHANAAVSGDALSARFGVSRQIVVQDIATLREQGYEIQATHYGYVLKATPLLERVFTVTHDQEQTADELELIVAQGAIVKDVFVEHKVYGKIVAPLNIHTKRHIDKFLEGVRNGTSVELMSITGGKHSHTVMADKKETLDNVEKALKEAGFLA